MSTFEFMRALYDGCKGMHSWERVLVGVFILTVVGGFFSLFLL